MKRAVFILIVILIVISAIGLILSAKTYQQNETIMDKLMTIEHNQKTISYRGIESWYNPGPAKDTTIVVNLDKMRNWKYIRLNVEYKSNSEINTLSNDSIYFIKDIAGIGNKRMVEYGKFSIKAFNEYLEFKNKNK